jgi:hypothetical protein
MMPAQVPRAQGIRNLFVGRIQRGATEAEVRDAFALVGASIGDVELVLNRVTGLPRGFAFVALLGRTATSTDVLTLEVLRRATLEGVLLDVRNVA